jgi:hypothetical protein
MMILFALMGPIVDGELSIDLETSIRNAVDIARTAVPIGPKWQFLKLRL